MENGSISAKVIELERYVPTFIVHFKDAKGGQSFAVKGTAGLLNCRDEYRRIPDVRSIQVLLPATPDKFGELQIGWLEELWLTAVEGEGVILKLASGAMVEFSGTDFDGCKTFFLQLTVDRPTQLGGIARSTG
jgi:hypothetical protein